MVTASFSALTLWVSVILELEGFVVAVLVSAVTQEASIGLAPLEALLGAIVAFALFAKVLKLFAEFGPAASVALSVPSAKLWLSLLVASSVKLLFCPEGLVFPLLVPGPAVGWLNC